MKLVSELRPQQIEKIVELLKEDGFKNIKVSENCIRFEEGVKIKREYEIFSTDLTNEDDLGVRTDFDFEAFLALNYTLKTRHSVSLGDSVEKKGSIEDACDYLGWRIVQFKDFNKEPKLWKAAFHFESVYEVIITNTPHIIVNDMVYEGDLSRLLSMGDKSSSQLLSGYKISRYLNKLNQ